MPVAGQRTHGPTFRVLKVTLRAVAAGAESAVDDCLAFHSFTTGWAKKWATDSWPPFSQI